MPWRAPPVATWPADTKYPASNQNAKASARKGPTKTTSPYEIHRPYDEPYPNISV